MKFKFMFMLVLAVLCGAQHSLRALDGWVYILPQPYYPWMYSNSQQAWYWGYPDGDLWVLNVNTGQFEILGGPSPAASGDATLHGQVLDFTSGLPVPDASIRIAGHAFFGESDGTFSVGQLAAGENVIVEVDAPGYADNIRLVNLFDGEESYMNVYLAAVEVAQAINPSQAATVTSPASGAQVALPANGLRLPDGGMPPGGAIVELSTLDPSRSSEIMPGDFTISGAPENERLESFGAIDIRARTDDGQALDLGPGQTAGIRIPLPAEPGEPPAQIPLFFFNPVTGMWQEEGVALLQGSGPDAFYSGTVGNLGTWNADAIYITTEIVGCVMDIEGNPVANARVTSQGLNYNGSASSYSDVSGSFRVRARSNAVVLVSASKGGQESSTTSVNTGAAGNVTNLDECLVLGGEGGAGTATIKLTWQENPRDLDSHLTGPTAAGGRFHIYYASKGRLDSEPYAQLDVDDMTSYGPEIITIPRIQSGVYKYAVHHYSGSSDIPNSGARVEVNVGGRVQVFTPPSGDGLYWYVFDLVYANGVASVVPVNTYEGSYPASSGMGDNPLMPALGVKPAAR